jgi:1-acyl-sn-glycerol-3-phosphate acyltransferase
VSAIVANHIGFVDALALLNIPEFKPSFTPASFVKKLPIADHFIQSLQGIYIDRDLDKESLDRLVEKIEER